MEFLVVSSMPVADSLARNAVAANVECRHADPAKDESLQELGPLETIAAFFAIVSGVIDVVNWLDAVLNDEEMRKREEVSITFKTPLGSGSVAFAPGTPREKIEAALVALGVFPPRNHQ